MAIIPQDPFWIWKDYLPISSSTAFLYSQLARINKEWKELVYANPFYWIAIIDHAWWYKGLRKYYPLPPLSQAYEEYLHWKKIYELIDQQFNPVVYVQPIGYHTRNSQGKEKRMKDKKGKRGGDEEKEPVKGSRRGKKNNNDNNDDHDNDNNSKTASIIAATPTPTAITSNSSFPPPPPSPAPPDVSKPAKPFNHPYVRVFGSKIHHVSKYWSYFTLGIPQFPGIHRSHSENIAILLLRDHGFSVEISCEKQEGGGKEKGGGRGCRAFIRSEEAARRYYVFNMMRLKHSIHSKIIQ